MNIYQWLFVCCGYHEALPLLNARVAIYLTFYTILPAKNTSKILHFIWQPFSQQTSDSIKNHRAIIFLKCVLHTLYFYIEYILKNSRCQFIRLCFNSVFFYNIRTLPNFKIVFNILCPRLGRKQLLFSFLLITIRIPVLNGFYFGNKRAVNRFHCFYNEYLYYVVDYCKICCNYIISIVTKNVVLLNHYPKNRDVKLVFIFQWRTFQIVTMDFKAVMGPAVYGMCWY